jgi:hypothetical protein
VGKHSCSPLNISRCDIVESFSAVQMWWSVTQRTKVRHQQSCQSHCLLLSIVGGCC